MSCFGSSVRIRQGTCSSSVGPEYKVKKLEPGALKPWKLGDIFYYSTTAVVSNYGPVNHAALLL